MNESHPVITAFLNPPDKGQGLVRDMIVRWALEEANLPYDVNLIDFKQLKSTAHRERNPFGQIPTYQTGDLTLFESGAIVLHIAETHLGLWPLANDPSREPARARAIMWMFAAASTIEPSIVELGATLLFEKERPWFLERKESLEKRVRTKLSELSNHLGDSEWLDGAFSAGDLLMISALRRLRNTTLVNEFTNLASYVARGEARPAFERAFRAQLAVFETSNMQRP